MRSSVLPAVCGVVFAVAALLASPSAAPAGTVPGGLNSQQIAQLRSQPLPILVPGYVPTGFRLVHIEAWNVKKHPAPANGYTLRYRSAAGHEFTIDVADSGFGDAEPDVSSYRRPFRAQSSVVGSTTMSPYHVGADGAPQWFYTSDYVSLQHLGNSHAMLIFSGDMPPDDLRRIYSSLQQVSR